MIFAALNQSLVCKGLFKLMYLFTIHPSQMFIGDLQRCPVYLLLQRKDNVTSLHPRHLVGGGVLLFNTEVLQNSFKRYLLVVDYGLITKMQIGFISFLFKSIIIPFYLLFIFDCLPFLC